MTVKPVNQTPEQKMLLIRKICDFLERMLNRATRNDPDYGHYGRISPTSDVWFEFFDLVQGILDGKVFTTPFARPLRIYRELSENQAVWSALKPMIVDTPMHGIAREKALRRHRIGAPDNKTQQQGGR
jgi:hypothetical protein